MNGGFCVTLHLDWRICPNAIHRQTGCPHKRIQTTMINRTLVRTKVVQTLFAYYKDGEKTPLTARKELLKSFSDTYSLYMMLLAFACELTDYAAEQMSEAKARAAITHTDYEPNYRFVNNSIARQLFNNRRLRNYMEEQDLRWDAGMNAVHACYKQLVSSDFYKEFMAVEGTPTYEQEKTLWRKIYNSLLNNDALQSALEDMEVALDQRGWTTDADVIITYVMKTIKHFREEKGDDQQLLEMFDNEEELNFAKDLLQLAIEHTDEYKELIRQTLQNWDAERLAFMDTTILITALTEIICCKDIAIEVSMNEYIEIAKEYSGEKSHIFINGVLDKVVSNLRRENVLFKV